RLFLATNRNLEQCIRTGQFREDLFWRIHGYRIEIPPLRERRDVIRDMAYAVLHSVNHRQRGDEQIGPSLDTQPNPFSVLPGEEGKGRGASTSTWVTRLDESDSVWCETYEWPGNVRELRQRMELYVYHDGQQRLKDVMPETSLDRDAVRSGAEGLIEDAVIQY